MDIRGRNIARNAGAHLKPSGHVPNHAGDLSRATWAAAGRPILATGGSYCFSTRKLKAATRELKANEEPSGPFAGHSKLLVCASVLRSLPPAAPPASPVAPVRGMIGRVLYIAAFTRPAGPHTDIQCRNRKRQNNFQIVSAAAKTLPTTPARKGKSTAPWLTSSMLPHVSPGASQLLTPASTPPRSYGRRQRSRHYVPQTQTN